MASGGSCACSSMNESGVPAEARHGEVLLAQPGSKGATPKRRSGKAKAAAAVTNHAVKPCRLGASGCFAGLSDIAARRAVLRPTRRQGK
jgi:hypothetical protein